MIRYRTRAMNYPWGSSILQEKAGKTLLACNHFINILD